jgi:hypothetical protein
MQKLIPGQDDNDSQQAAEAMIQLGYYPTQQSQDESMDFDPNYDPSDFLMKKDSSSQESQLPQQQQQQYQESFDYSAVGIQEGAGGDEINPTFFSGAYQQPAFGDFSAYQQQSQEEFMPQQQQLMSADGSGGVLADLEISDSDDDEDQNESNENPDTSKEEDGLWF